jgi:ATP-dependent helicase/nuclease subunit B
VKTYLKNDTNEVQDHILKNLYSFSAKPLENQNLYFFEYSTPEKEVIAISNIIKFEVESNGKRFFDFNISLPNLKEKQSVFEKVFKEQDIPFFIDSGINPENTRPVQFLDSIFCFLKEENRENFIKIGKNFYSGLNFSDSCLLENYLNMIGKMDLEELINNGELDNSQKQFFSKIIKIKNSYRDCSNFHNYIELTKEILKEFDIESKTNLLINQFNQNKELKLEKIYLQIHKRIEHSLELMEKQEISADFDEFTQVFKSILNSKEIFSIPASIDCVFIGDSVKSFFEERKVLFVSGASQGALPVVIKDYSVLSDKDIDSLSNKLEISPTTKMINKRNKFKLFQDLTLSKEKIIFSYASSSLGEKSRPSSLIEEFQKIFLKEGKRIEIANDFFDKIAKENLIEKDSCLDLISL